MPSATLLNNKTESVKFDGNLERTDEEVQSIDTNDRINSDDLISERKIDLITTTNRIHGNQNDFDNNKSQLSSRCEYSLSLHAKDNDKPTIPTCM